MADKLTTLENYIRDGLKDTQKTIDSRSAISESIWTKKVKKALIKLGQDQDKDWAVYASGTNPKTDFHEWLWDVVWAKQKDKLSSGQRMERGYQVVEKLVLICECEWNIDQTNVLVDFQKLVVGMADLRLYVFPMPKRDAEGHAARIYSWCRNDMCPASPQKNFRYLLIGLPAAGSKAKLFCRSWQK